MQRVVTPPRLDWQRLVESKGLTFHTLDGIPYWDESVYYLFEATEIDAIEAATQQLHEMCLQAAGYLIENDALDDINIPRPFHRFIQESWERDERSIYGRFDLAYDGSGPPKLLEYNADTPTSLLEAAVIQWFWFQDVITSLSDRDKPSFDQFNSLHEALIDAWGRVRQELGQYICFSGLSEPSEDLMTITYLRDTAIQAGISTQFLNMSEIGWNAARGVFTDLRERTIPVMFKLYPWEWMIHEAFGHFLPAAPTRWLEPPWKMVLSNKGILAVLWRMFPTSPYLLRAEFEPFGDTYAIKPILSREGANVTLMRNGQVIAETDGEYGEAPVVYQSLANLPEFSRNYPVLGSWIIDGEARGMGIREDVSPITGNVSRFVPHLFRKSASAKPPIVGSDAKPMGAASGGVWDRWLDS